MTSGSSAPFSTLLAATLLATSACAPSFSALSQRELSTHGSRVYSARPSRVLAAVLKTMVSRGYDIARIDEGIGLVQTRPKTDEVGATASPELGFSRRYDVYLTKRNAEISVVLRPRRFRSSAEIALFDATWQRWQQRLQWANFFYEISDANR